ncbi:hypothetical protein HID58_042826, partial [Brassica napus]
ETLFLSSRHLHLRRSLFRHNKLRLRHLYRNSTLSPASSTITHLRLCVSRQTRNQFHLIHIRIQLQATLICESLTCAIRPLMCSRRGKNPLCMVLAPTRALARQVEKEFREFALSLDTICLYG